MVGQFVICRSRDDGVKCGWLVSLVPSAAGLACAVLREARQIHYWEQNEVNFTLVELSNRGVVPPASARISDPSAEPAAMFGVCGVLVCTDEARENLSQSRWNKPYSPSASPRPRRKATGS